MRQIEAIIINASKKFNIEELKTGYRLIPENNQLAVDGLWYETLLTDYGLNYVYDYFMIELKKIGYDYYDHVGSGVIDFVPTKEHYRN